MTVELLTCSLLITVIASIATASVNLPKIIEKSTGKNENYRLLRYSEPISYNLYLDISDETFTSYNGSVDIEMRYLYTSFGFYLNSAGVEIDRASIKVTKTNGENLRLTNFLPMPNYEQLFFGFSERLENNATYKVHIKFSNSIGMDMIGLFRSSYLTENETRYIAATQFESTYARTVFPCYDEPSYKAYFNVTIKHRSKYHALSNMPIRERIIEDQFTTTHFERSSLMSSYLLAFLVSDYKTLSEEMNRIKVYAPEHLLPYTTYARDFAEKSLQSLEDLLGLKYQLPKVDLVAISDFDKGAMENWGLITFGSIYVIYNETDTSARLKQDIAMLITHELAHSWFGNEVTQEWWSYLWLSEGFARYFEYFVTAQIEDTWHLWDQFVVDNVHAAFSHDDQADNRPMSFYATEPDELNRLFDYVVYAKSASIIRMFQNVIGFETFKMAIHDYITSRSYMTTKPDYLYKSIEKFNAAAIPSDSVKIVFDNWANNSGYPVVNVTRNGNIFTFSQKRFWMPLKDETAPADTKFYVPLNYATSEEANFEDTTSVDWLTPDVPTIQKILSSDIKWILVNKQQTGFYRVNYDNDNWDALIELLKSDKLYTISVLNRAQMVDDASNLAKAGELSYAITLSLLEYLEFESEYVPWSTAYNCITHLNRMFSANQQYSRFEELMRKITSRIYERVGLIETVPHIYKLHRDKTIYLACYFGLQSCINEAHTLMQHMLSNESYIIPLETQPAFFCAVSKYVTDLNDDFTQMVFNRSLQTNSNDFLEQYITGLGCTRNKTKIEQCLLLTLTNPPGFQLADAHRLQILVAILNGSYEGLRACLKFMLEYYPDISYKLGSTETVFIEFGNRISSKQEYDMLQQIIGKYGGTFTDSLKFAALMALMQADQNLEWTNKYSEVIANWLESNEYTQMTTTTEPGVAEASSNVAGTLLTLLMVLIVSIY